MKKLVPAVGVFVLILVFSLIAFPQTKTDEQAGEHFAAAQQADRQKDLPTAVEEYRAALKLKPGVAEAWVNLGLDLYVLHRENEAIEAFQQGLKRKPDMLPGNLFLGMAYLHNSQSQKAIAPLKKVIALNPKELKAYINLSYAYQETGQLEEAARILEKAKTLFPDNTEVLYNLGKSYTRLMEDSFKQMADVDGDSYRFHEVMGDSYQLRRDYPNAQAEYKKAIEKCPDPSLPGLHYALGSSYWLEAKWDLALEEFQKELEISPYDYMTNWKLGDTYLLKRDYDDARIYLTKAIKEHPDFGQAYRDMGKLCLQADQPQEAVGYLKKVTQLAPEEPTTHYLLAQAYRKLGNPAEVKVELENFQRLREAEAARSAKHPDTSALSGVDTSTDRPQQDDTLEDIK
jgi:tetratricopeptide (TPR) repeat protein